MRTDVKVGLVCVLALFIAVVAYFVLQGKSGPVPASGGGSGVASVTPVDSTVVKTTPAAPRDEMASATPPGDASSATPNVAGPPVAFTHQAPTLAQTPSVYSPPASSATGPGSGSTLYPPGGRGTLLPPLTTGGSTPTTAPAPGEMQDWQQQHTSPSAPGTPTLGGGRSTEVEPGERPHDSLIEPLTPAHPAAGSTLSHDTGPVSPGGLGGATYAVVSGDNLTVIAKKNHTTVAALKAANPSINPDRLKVKQVINLPAPGAEATTPTTRPARGHAAGAATRPSGAALRHHPGLSTAAPAAGSTLYTVKRGDTLRKIAKAVYGDENQWRRIFRANRGKLSSPNAIRPGQVIDVPK